MTKATTTMIMMMKMACAARVLSVTLHANLRMCLCFQSLTTQVFHREWVKAWVIREMVRSVCATASLAGVLSSMAMFTTGYGRFCDSPCHYIASLQFMQLCSSRRPCYHDHLPADTFVVRYRILAKMFCMCFSTASLACYACSVLLMLVSKDQDTSFIIPCDRLVIVWCAVHSHIINTDS